MSTFQLTTSDRVKAATAALLLELLLGYALIVGLSADIPAKVGEALKIFNLAVPPPPPAIERPAPQPVKSRKQRGAASPRNIRSKPTEIVAPPPVLPPLQPPPVIVAPKAGAGNDPSAGASRLAGPGTGAGGIGTGTGSGGAGEGEGGDRERPPRWRSGRIKDSDYPPGVEAHGTVSVRYTVETDGRVTGCIVTRSSGNLMLDRITCRLIEERYRYKPKLDGAGRPVRSLVGDDHEWEAEDKSPTPPAD
jgi:protein TonB